jgi:energy-converting hydrogenase Eha subunit A
METVEQMKELRVIEHEQMILEYVEQVPLLRVASITHRGIVGAMMTEYNEKYFPKPTEPKETE